MGEDKQEEAKPETKPEEKKEEKAEEKKEEKAEEKKEEEAQEKKGEEKPPAPPSPVVLFVDMHCVGCANKVKKCILKFKGVEEVDVDMGQNQVKIKGIVEPQALCMRIQKKTKRKAIVLSPLPPPEGESKPEVVKSQVSGMTTVVLNVNMHCEGCARQLKAKILKMKGVQSAETELSSEKVTVTGTMDADRLVQYVYRRTRKLAKIVPQPLPEKPEEEKKPEEPPKEAEKPAEEAQKPEEKKEEEKAPEQSSSESNEKEKNTQEEKPAETIEEEPKKEVPEEIINLFGDDMAKKIVYWPPVYVIESVPPPQLFSDENPNACCIS